MSIVGTRPPLVGEVSLYELHHRSRLGKMNNLIACAEEIVVREVVYV